MPFRELTILLPCHSLEDFPLYHVGQDADSLLACWTALWHPALIVAAGGSPKWHRVDLPPEDVQDKLIMIPTISVSQLPAGFSQRAKESGALVLRGEESRDNLVAKALERLGADAPSVDPELVGDFFALSFGYLQVQVLTRQMRYASNLDEHQFFGHLIAAAKAAVAADSTESVNKITACFNMLAEERDHYYSVDAYLIDLVLTTDETLGPGLRCELASRHAINLLISGDDAMKLKQREPETVNAALKAIEEARLGIVGGEQIQRRLPLLSCEDLLAGLKEGQRSLEEVFHRRAEVFGRRMFGLTPCLPGILEKLRYRGAFHATFDDGQFPAGSQIKTRWQGADSGVIDAIAKPPLDASKPETFLSYAQRLGESMDTDHVATLCLAHWPGYSSPWFEDLKRCTKYTSALGKFITVERYFLDTYLPGHLDRFESNQYRSPYLRQDVIRKRPDPISSLVRYWVRQVAIDAMESLATLSSVVANVVDESIKDPGRGRCDFPESDADAAAVAQGRAELEVTRFAQRLPRSSGIAEPGYLVVNPFSFARRVGIDVSKLSQLPAIQSPVSMVDETAGVKRAVVDLPPMGFAWITGGAASKPAEKAEPQLVEDARESAGAVYLRNELMEATINPVTGALQSLMDYRSRGNRLSQQLALRTPAPRGAVGEVWRDPHEMAKYSVTVADETVIPLSTKVLGEVVTSGRLVQEDGEALAKFRQTWRLWRGSRVIQCEVQLEPFRQPSSDPWNSYYASRIAWADETAELHASINQTHQPIAKKRIESPLYIEVSNGDKRTTFFPMGMPYHRRIGSRMLDSILMVRGETARVFKFGIGIDVNQPWSEAISTLAPTHSTWETAASPAPRHSWLFHIETRSVVATHWSVLVVDGKPAGVRVRLLESSGRTGRVRMSSFRPFVAARQVNFLGEPISELTVTDGKFVAEISANEWIEVEAKWS